MVAQTLSQRFRPGLPLFRACGAAEWQTVNILLAKDVSRFG